MGFLTWSLHLCVVLGNLGGAWALEIDYWVCVWHVTIGMEPGLQSCAWLRISDKPPDTLLHFCVCEWSLPCNFFFLFFFQLIMQPLCFSPGLPAIRYRLVCYVFIFLCSKDLRDSPFDSISFSFFYMLAAVISILAFLRSLTYSSLSLSSAATVAHVENALTSTGKIPLFRHSWLKVRWWHSVT